MAFYKNIGGRRYHRTVWDTTKRNAQEIAKKLRKMGYLARAVQQENGKYAVYEATKK